MRVVDGRTVSPMVVPVDSGRPTPVVGRHRESSCVEAVLDRMLDGPTALVIEGDPGIGKSTVVRWAMARATERSVLVLACHPSQAETRLAFSALADLLVAIDAELLDALPRPQRRALEAVLMRSEPDATDPMNRAVPIAVGSVVELLAHRSPVLFLIDDAHWLDRSSEQALRFVFRRIPRRGVGIIAASSTQEGSPDPLGLAASLAGPVDRCRLRPLAPAALQEIIADRLGLTLPCPLLARIHAASGGNPFFALEFARALTEEGAADDPTAALRLTRRLHKVVDDRIAVLSPCAAEICLYTAVAAHPTVELLLTMTGAGSWESSGGADAERAGVLELTDRAVRFTHPLLASAVVDRACPARVRAIHRRLAELSSDAEERARHLAASLTRPDEPTARALDRAAAQAWNRGAPAAAAELAERAVEVTADDAARIGRMLAASSLQLEAANPTRARALLRRVLDDDASGGPLVEALTQLGSVRFDLRDPWEGVVLLERALGHVTSADHRLRARVGIECAWALLFAGDRAAALQRARMAHDHACRSRDPTLRRAAAAVLSLAHLLAGNGLRAELVEVALSGPDSSEPLAFSSLLPAAAALQYSDQLDRARDLLERLHQIVRTRRGEVQLPMLAWQLTDLELRAGRWDAAEQVAQDAVEGARLRSGEVGLAVTLALRARVHALRDRIDDARADLQEATRGIGRAGRTSLGLSITTSTVVLETCLDDPAAVHAVAGPLVAATRSGGPTDPAMLRWVPDEVEALLALDQHDAAAEVLSWYEDLCRRTDRRSGHAAAARCRAQIAALAGRHDEAVRLATSSAEQCRRLGTPFARARALLVAGRIQRRNRQKRAALGLLTAARTAFEELGAPAWVERTSDELLRVGIRGAQRGDNGLTAAEQQVAALVAQGRTNREAGAALFMSHKTVEAHLTRIYARFGIRSRAELAARMAGGQTPAPGRTSP